MSDDAMPLQPLNDTDRARLWRGASIGRRLELLRIWQGLNQIEVAAVARVNRRTVQRVEEGGDVKLSTLEAIIAALGVSLADIDGSALPAVPPPSKGVIITR